MTGSKFGRHCRVRVGHITPPQPAFLFWTVVVFHMVSDQAHISRPEGLTETESTRVTEAFAALANETRVEILLTLWSAMDPLPERDASETALSFVELYDRVRYDQTSNFQYHLEKLTGHFVHKTDAGYTLTTSAKRVLSTVMAGTLTDAPSFSEERIAAACMLCGTSTIVDYSDGILIQRCPSCDGVTKEHNEPPGVIAKEYRPPIGLKNRTPQEFVQQSKTWQRHQRHAFIEGACPECSGTITTTIEICDDHDRHDLRVCHHCERVHEIVVSFVCDVCKSSMRTGIWNTILTDVAVIAFFHDHGLDTKALEDRFEYGILFDAVEQVTVDAKEPLEIAVKVELDGDNLTVILDDEADVIGVTE